MRTCCWIAILFVWLASGSARGADRERGPQDGPRPQNLVGLHSYAEMSIEAGESIHFRTSSEVPYELSVCRLGPLIDDPSGDSVLTSLTVTNPVHQAIYPGSYIHVESGLPSDGPLEALTLECWVRPWRLNAWQSLITQHNYPADSGVGLSLDAEGKVQFYLGDGEAYQPERSLAGPVLAHREWHHVVGVWDGKSRSLWVNGQRVAHEPFAGPVKAADCPLRLGACGYDGPAVNLLDGDLAMPVVYGRGLGAKEIEDRFRQQGLKPATGEDVLACWPLNEERGNEVADCSPHARHGRIVNSGTWMIGGPSFDGSKVPRFGDYDPAKDPQRGHGLRLASDDLFDCHWQVTETIPIPKSAKSGMYVGRFRFDLDNQPRTYHVTFVVRRAADEPKAPILVLAASNTWLAYNSKPFVASPVGLHQFWGTEGIENSPGNPPAYSCYLNHAAGLPTYQIGVNMPCTSAGPYVLYSAPSVGYSHLMRAERYLHMWLENNGYAYDMITDGDLHRDPGQLAGYQVVAINGHSEYWSAEGYDAVDKYLCEGGDAIVLSGNSICWRVSYNDEGTIMECRKYDPNLGGRPGCTIGELWHSQDGRRGGLARECGYPSWKLVGLETLGWWDTAGESFTPYLARQPDHFLFRGPHPVPLAENEPFGAAPDGGLPRGVGHESDVRLDVLRKLTKEIPEGAILPEEPAGIVTLAHGDKLLAAEIDYFGRPIRQTEPVSCQMIYWERPQGGRVFHSGSIGTGWALASDVRLQNLLRNVLHHFGVAGKEPK